MAIYLNRWKETLMGRELRNGINDNWKQLEQSHTGIEQMSERAVLDAIEAKEHGKDAKDIADNVQKQLSEIVVNGDSSPEAAQARVDYLGVTHPSLKIRADSDAKKIGNPNDFGITPQSVAKSLGDRGLNVKDCGAKGDGITDDTDTFLAISQLVVNGDIILPPGTYKITRPIIFSKYVRIIGSGNKVTTIDIQEDINAITFSGSPHGDQVADGYLINSSVGLKNLTIKGKSTFTKNAVSFIYVGRANLEDVIFTWHGGNALYLRSSQDFVIHNCYFRYNGNQSLNKASIFMDDYIVDPNANSKQNVNDIKFIGCTFEHNNGPLIISSGLDNNSNTWVGCKFEYVSSDGDKPAIQIKNGSRFSFIGSRFTHYNPTGMFELVDSWGIEINGTCLNNSEPIYFAKLVNSRAVDIHVNGRKCGKVIKTGNTYNIEESIIDQEHNGYFYNFVLHDHNEYESVNLRNIHYPDDKATIIDDGNGTDGCAIQQVNTNKRVLVMNLNKDKVKNEGLSISVRINSKNGGQYPVYLQQYLGEGSLFKVLTVKPGESWYKLSIPRSRLQMSTTLIILTPSAQDEVIVKQVFYERKYYGIEPPKEGAWELGDIVYNDVNINQKTDYVGWQCIKAGTPGVWKRFGYYWEEPSWVDASLQNGVTSLSGYTVQYKLFGTSTIKIRGVMTNFTNEIVAFILPDDLRPLRTKYHAALVTDESGMLLGSIRLEIGTNGRVRPIGVTSNMKRIYLDDLIVSID